MFESKVSLLEELWACETFRVRSTAYYNIMCRIQQHVVSGFAALHYISNILPSVQKNRNS